MGLGQRVARHETVAAAKIAGSDPSVYWDYRPGQRVMTKDGFPGRVEAVHDGPLAGNEEYGVLLDNGMGGGTYTSSMLRPLTHAEANVDHATAASDYPELAEILHERPPLATSVTAALTPGHDDLPDALEPDDGDGNATTSSKTAAFVPHEHPETEDWHGSEGDCRGTMCTSEHNPENAPERHAPDHVRDYAHMRFDGPGAGGTIKHPTEPDTYIHGPDNFWDGPTHFKYDPEHHEQFKRQRAQDAEEDAAAAAEHARYRSCEHGMSADLCMGPNHYPTHDQEMRGHYSSKTATDHIGDPSYTEGGTCPHCGSKGRMLTSVTGLAKCQDCGHSKQGSLLADEDPWQMVVEAAADSDFRFHVTASWADVRNKAKRLRAEGHVNIIEASSGTIAANVKGDHHVYETVLTRSPGSKQSVAQWACGCKWAAYSWGRSGAYKKYEGRMCSHALALQYEAQSRGMFGRTIEEDQKSPGWLKPRTRIVTEFDRDKGKNQSRPAQPRKRDLQRTYSMLAEAGPDPLASPISVLVATALRDGDDPAEIVMALTAAHMDGRTLVREALIPEHHGDQTPCSNPACGHPEGVHGGEHTECTAAGCECHRYKGGVAQRGASLQAEARHPHPVVQHHHPHGGHGGTPARGGEYPVRGGVWGGGFAWGLNWNGEYGDHDGDTEDGSSSTPGASGDSAGGDSDDGGGMSMGGAADTGGVMDQPAADHTPWKATQRSLPSDNPASTGWAATGDPKNWEGATDVGNRLGSLDDEAMWEPEIERTAAAAPLLALAPALVAGMEGAGAAAAGAGAASAAGAGAGAAAAGEAAAAGGAAAAGEAGAAGGAARAIPKGIKPPMPGGGFGGGQQQGNTPQQPQSYEFSNQTERGIQTRDNFNKMVQGSNSTLNEEPEAALPVTDGTGDPGGDMGDESMSDPFSTRSSLVEGSIEDVVAQFQRTAGQSIMSDTGTGAGEGSSDIAAQAAAFLATGQMPVDPGMSATAMKTFSPGEQRQIIDEGLDVQASNLDRLDIAGTHYEALEAALASTGDPDDDGDLWS